MFVILGSLLNVVVTHKVFIGIGSNADRKKNISASLKALKKHFSKLTFSNVYESVPMGISGSRNYYNLVAGFETDLPPEEINKRLKEIEKVAGQRRKHVCPLDLDLLLFDDLIIHKNGLDIPRRDIIDYAYVAIPLAEIHGDQIHPETGQSFHENSQSENMANQKVWPVDFIEGKNNEVKNQ